MQKEAIRSGSVTRIKTRPDNIGQLENRNYMLGADDFGFFLKDYDDFDLPKKIYGPSLDEITNRVLTAFQTIDRGNIGVLLSGLKGTGKSIQAKHIAATANMPVIIINSPYNGSALAPFLDDLPAKCVILFDEFEKVYRKNEDQETILPILDGLSTNRHIFVFTVNGGVSQYLIGRPGRIRYHVDYSGLPLSIVEQIVDDSLQVPSQKERIMTFFGLSTDINMDTVVSVVQEMNMFPNHKFDDLARIFNLSNPLDATFDVKVKCPCICVNREKHSSDLIEEVENYLPEKYGIEYFNDQEGAIYAEVYKENEQMKKEIAKKFNVDIYESAVKTRNWNLQGFLSMFHNSNVDFSVTKDYDSSVPYQYTPILTNFHNTYWELENVPIPRVVSENGKVNIMFGDHLGFIAEHCFVPRSNHYNRIDY